MEEDGLVTASTHHPQLNRNKAEGEVVKEQVGRHTFCSTERMKESICLKSSSIVVAGRSIAGR